MFAPGGCICLAMEKAGWELKGLHFCSRSSSSVLAALTTLSSLLQKHRGGKKVLLIPFHNRSTFITEAYLVLNEKEE